MSAPSEDPESLFRRAAALQQAGDGHRAIPLYEAVIAAAPAHYGAHLNLGVALRSAGRAAQAIERFLEAEALRPHDPTPALSAGAALFDLSRLDEALGAFDRALARGPEVASAHYRRGFVLQALARYEEALASYDAALRFEPANADAQLNRAGCLARLDRIDEALAAYDLALSAPAARAHQVHYNRARVLEDLGRLHKAIQGFDQAIAAKPDFAQARFDRGRCRLGLGDLQAGWLDYEHRWRSPTFLRTAAGPFLSRVAARLALDTSAADVAGRDVLVVAEQGVGDVVMFSSILPDLAAAARSVRLACEARLHGLFQRSLAGVEILGLDDLDAAAAQAEVVLGLGSLGRLYRNRVEDFPRRPYLKPGPAAVARGAATLGPRDGRLRVGLSWRGGLERSRQSARSIPLVDLRPLLDVEGCEMISLQYGDHALEVDAVNATLPRPIRTLPAQAISDFEDLAGVLGGLDVVVSVQTALIHLAGATDTTCLVMVPSAPEWRYSAAFPDMPWYRSTQLVRQSPGDGWGPVLDRVGERLRQFTAEGAPRYSGS